MYVHLYRASSVRCSNRIQKYDKTSSTTTTTTTSTKQYCRRCNVWILVSTIHMLYVHESRYAIHITHLYAAVACYYYCMRVQWVFAVWLYFVPECWCCKRPSTIFNWRVQINEHRRAHDSNKNILRKFVFVSVWMCEIIFGCKIISLIFV